MLFEIQCDHMLRISTELNADHDLQRSAHIKCADVLKADFMLGNAEWCREIPYVFMHISHLSATFLAVWRKRAWSFSFRLCSACVIRALERSRHCLQLAICWASLRSFITYKDRDTHTHIFFPIHHCTKWINPWLPQGVSDVLYLHYDGSDGWGLTP